MIEIQLLVNGKKRTAVVEARDTLLDVIRDRFGLTGAKRGCDEAVCGSCAVLLDQKPVCSCMIFAVECIDHEIITVEGLTQEGGKLSPIQNFFIACDAMQCGFCTSGQIIVAEAYVRSSNNLDHAVPNNHHQLESHIKDAMSGNLCRCGCYNGILEAIKLAVTAAAPKGEITNQK